MHSNLDDIVKRVWCAALQPADRDYATNYRPFASVEEARNHVKMAAALLENDHIACPLHNDMIVLKSIGLPHEMVASAPSPNVAS